MKAYVLNAIKEFECCEVEKPSITADSLLLEVHATGICGSDIPRIYKDGTYSYPLIPGHEFAGTVVEAGSEENQLWVGKRVGVFPLIPCQKCECCLQKKYEMCMHYSYLGSRTNGGFAQFVRVPAWNLIELPEQVSMVQAAMLEPMAVAVHAIRRANVKKTDQIAVCG